MLLIGTHLSQIGMNLDEISIQFSRTRDGSAEVANCILSGVCVFCG